MAGSEKGKHRPTGQTQCPSNPELNLTDSETNPALGQAQFVNPGGISEIKNVNPKPCVNLNPDVKNFKYYTEEQLEELLSKKLLMIYNDAYLSLISLGYHPHVAVKAILKSGFAFGKMDILTNIVHNSLGYIKTGLVTESGTSRDGHQVLRDMKVMVEKSLEVMIYLLRQIRPYWIKGDALWCLLMSNFHLVGAITMKVPFVTSDGESHAADNYGLYKVQVDQDSGDGGTYTFNKNGPSERNSVGILEREHQLLERFNLTPYLVSQMRKNVLNYAAACRANMKASPEQPRGLNNSWPSKDPCDLFEWEESCMINIVLGGFCRLNLNEMPESEPVDPKIEIISSLVRQIKEVKEQLKIRKEWAHKKVIQAAKKVSHDIIELKMLRMEMEEKQQVKSHQLETDNETMKRLAEIENTLRKTGSQVDLVNATVKKLRCENAEIGAEMEAFKLSASESDKKRVEIEKKERKCLKRITALEKHYNKLLDEIEEEKRKSLQLQEQLAHFKRAQEDIEVTWRQEVQARELAISQVREELRLKKEADVNIKRKKDALHLKTEIDGQRYKDDMQRYEQEISHLQMSLDSSDTYHLQELLLPEELGFGRLQRDTFGMMLHDLIPDLSEEVICDRVCLICMEQEATIVFLPCAHQVLCARCSEDNCENVESRCPCCQEWIDKIIHVYGARL